MAQTLAAIGLVAVNQIIDSSQGVAQLEFSGGGNIQVYLTKHGKTEGNAHLNGRPSKVKDFRAAILRSCWFADAIGGVETCNGGAAKATAQPDGSVLLPPVSIELPANRLESVIREVEKKLGPKGKKALRHYIKMSGAPDNSPAMQLLSKVFGSQEEAKAKKKKKKKGD